MAELIESLLILARVTQADTQHDPVDLSELVLAAAERLRASQPDRQVNLQVAAGLTNHGDSRLLSVAFDNLLGNAWKFTRDHPEARVEFGCTDQNQEPVYFLRDNGVGFDMAFSSKLFGVFQRLHAGTEFEGTGIGLATVQRIIQRHGGRVWAEAKVGQGASFYFTLNEMGKHQ
jgi:light-regulated signal transduction histidine kinase (bacteriophytochrome)